MRRVPAFRWPVARFFLRFVAAIVFFPFRLAGFPAIPGRRIETTSPRFRFLAGRRRGAARRTFRGLLRFATGRVRAEWRFVLSAVLRRFPPKPALICLALSRRFAIFFRFPRARPVAGFATLVSRTANAISFSPPGKAKGATRRRARKLYAQQPLLEGLLFPVTASPARSVERAEKP
jgi:hypothetical protein